MSSPDEVFATLSSPQKRLHEKARAFALSSTLSDFQKAKQRKKAMEAAAAAKNPPPVKVLQKSKRKVNTSTKANRKTPSPSPSPLPEPTSSVDDDIALYMTDDIRETDEETFTNLGTEDVMIKIDEKTTLPDLDAIAYSFGPPSTLGDGLLRVPLEHLRIQQESQYGQVDYHTM